MYTVSQLLYYAMLVFHSNWQDTACDSVAESRVARCEQIRDAAQETLSRWSEMFAYSCGEEGVDCLLTVAVAEKEYSLGDIGNGSIGNACLHTMDVGRVTARTEREGFCDRRLTWESHDGSRSVTRPARIVAENDRRITFDTCCAREIGLFQILPANAGAGRQVRYYLPGVSDNLIELPSSYRERMNLAARDEINIAIGIEEISEHIAMCRTSTSPVHDLQYIAAYNQGDCVVDEGFRTYYSGVRYKYRMMCEAELPDGSRIADHHPGCGNIPGPDPWEE